MKPVWQQNRVTSVFAIALALSVVASVAVAKTPSQASPLLECTEAMDVGNATKVGVKREGENLRLLVELPSCPNLKIVGVWKALELSQGSRQLTGKLRGLSGRYEPGEKSIIGRNLSDSNPFLEPGDLAALKGALSLRGTLAIEYVWQKPAAPKKKMAKALKGKKAKSSPSAPPSQSEAPPSEGPAKVRINLPVSVQVQSTEST